MGDKANKAGKDAIVLGLLIVGLVLGFIVGMCAASIYYSHNYPSDATLKDVCHNLDNRTINYKVVEGKLNCIVPSFDHTSNIIITNNGDNQNG